MGIIGRILRNIPGFRSKKTWKMIVASTYYLLSLLLLFIGIGYYLFSIAIAFVGVYSIDGWKNWFNSKRDSNTYLRFLLSLVLLFISAALVINEYH